MKALPRSLKFAACFEGATLLLLVLVAVPLKYCGDNATLVRLLGPVHGLTFLTFLYQIGKAWAQRILDWKQALRFLVASFFPGGTFIVTAWEEK